MRRSSYLHNLSLIRLLTFASVIGSQFHVLSTTLAAKAAAAGASPATGMVTNSHFDAYDTTKRTSTSASAAAAATATMSLTSASATIATTTTTTTASLFDESKTSSIIMTSSSSSGSGGSSVSASGHIYSGSSTSVMPENSFTAASYSTHRNVKSTSKIPLDFTLSKNHWTNSETLNFRGSPPAAASSSSSSSSSSSGADVERPQRTFRNKHHHEHHWGPFFEEPLNSTATGDNVVSAAHLFTEAVLNCRVGMLKDKTVMWVRRTTEKVSLLTVGNVTYSGDPRIRVKFQYPNNWRLLINPVQREDAGVYMCQVSTHPPRVFTTNLTILEPPLRLIDEQEREVGDRYYKSGSTIDLQCQVSRSFLLKEKLSILKSIQPYDQNQTKSNVHKSNTGPSRTGAAYNELIANKNQTLKQSQALEKQFNSFIFWTKDDEVLPATAIRRSSSTEKWLTSRVSIPDAKLADSGNYSCSIGKLFTAIVQVQVLTGELPAAVQHNSAPPATSTPPLLLLHLCWIHFIVAFTVFSRNISPSIRIGLAKLHTVN